MKPGTTHQCQRSGESADDIEFWPAATYAGHMDTEQPERFLNGERAN